MVSKTFLKPNEERKWKPMKLVSALAALALLGGVTPFLVSPSSAHASLSCSPEVVSDGGTLYALVYDAKPIRKADPRVKAILPKRTVGAKMYLNAQKGMSSEYLHRAAVCHMNANTRAYEHDPLRVEGIESLRVYPAGGSFVISLTGKDSASGREIWQRAEILTTEIDTAAADSSAKAAF